ncbi:hypothetical protein GCM10010885_23510 [Alicyclobacillus cellulosilyticus]|uniref:Carbohydrate ABC transporter substrate-binding protein (CUT1 family) n=1 Tax=Alicyclobacillus cellulosilyticus TaxID=1003997 RepID=A0A917KJA2_9BACL|nr:sugar ABC transporter substrate-binding protein [Alicyclobacillus cellulosilyticus]GGJ13528.1 hypothetical protein GCM10010885_23510 [Alicyclobacillus cellulosilyticus]
MRKIAKLSIAVSTGLASLGALSLAPVLSTHATQPVTLTWMVPEDPLIDTWAKAVAKGFEKAHPGVTVKVLTPGSTAYGQKLLTLVAAGQTPDVFTDWGNTGIFTLVHHNLVLNLSPYVKSLPDHGAHIPEVYRKEFSINGQLFGIPWNSNPTFIVYNVDLFKKYHVPLPPTSWNDKHWNLNTLLEDAKRLTHNTSDPKNGTYGLVMQSGSDGSLAWLWGADPFNNKGGPEYSRAYHGAPISATYATRKGMVQAMAWLADLTTKYKVSPSQGVLNAMSTLGNPFFTGRIGMVEVAGGWLMRQAAVAEPKFHWAIAPFPYGPAGVNTGQREDNAFYIAKSSKNPELAFRLIEYATTGEGAEEFVQFAKGNPPYTGNKYFRQWENAVFQIPGISMTKSQFAQVFLGGIQHDYPDPGNIIDNATDFGNTFTQLMANVWLGKQSAAQGLAAVQSAWQKYLQH